MKVQFAMKWLAWIVVPGAWSPRVPLTAYTSNAADDGMKYRRPFKGAPSVRHQLASTLPFRRCVRLHGPPPQVIGRLIPLEIIRLRATCLQVEQFEPALALIELLDNN